ncbi:TadE/TadG family type IV pilus assembly protein [Vibrio hangzhouensis]|uniref:TadE-like protein n=1 Tax=Vibrio hangzhouensis TaxID=462991 RepID=A0A1H5YJX5_9VIBR|nr:TadE family protein [Vibrio hangzhouensis]SEG24368.1 TadE-like protein [Vibrio hangzhouensis]
MRTTAKRQKGITIIEFTLIALGLFVLMFLAFEIGRYMFSMQMLNEMTRKSARLAVVCSILDQQDIASLPEVVENRPLGFDTEDLVISYLDRTGSVVETTGFGSMSIDEQNFVLSQVRFVKSEVMSGETGYRFRFFPLLAFVGDGGAVSVPPFTTTLPVESLGIVRPNTGSLNGTIEDC